MIILKVSSIVLNLLAGKNTEMIRSTKYTLQKNLCNNSFISRRLLLSIRDLNALEIENKQNSITKFLSRLYSHSLT